MYTYKFEDGWYKTTGRCMFKTEEEATVYCDMWNRHIAAIDALRELPFELSRDAYEAACIQFGYTPLSDAECDGYGVKYGEFNPWMQDGKAAGYTPEYAQEMALAKRRMWAIEAERAKLPPRPPRQPAYPNGRRLDCGHTVYDGEVMSTSSGSSCPDCYDRMSDI